MKVSIQGTYTTWHEVTFYCFIHSRFLLDDTSNYHKGADSNEDQNVHAGI